MKTFVMYPCLRHGDQINARRTRCEKILRDDRCGSTRTIQIVHEQDTPAGDCVAIDDECAPKQIHPFLIVENILQLRRLRGLFHGLCVHRLHHLPCDGGRYFDYRLIDPLPRWWHRHDQVKRRIPALDELYGCFGNLREGAFVVSVLESVDKFTEFRAFCVELRISE